jgi:hypothetical protein
MDQRLLAQLTGMANKHAQALNALPVRERMEYMRSLVGSADCAWAVFPDGEGSGVPHVILVKGKRVGRRMEKSGRLKGKVTAVPCIDRFMAEALNDAYGDGSTTLSGTAQPSPEVAALLRANTTEMRRLVDEANRNGDLVRDGKVTVEDLFLRADVVHAVWSDPSSPGGVGKMLAKGEGRLMLISQGTKGVPTRAVALRFLDRMQAEQAWLSYGDGRGAMSQAS